MMLGSIAGLSDALDDLIIADLMLAEDCPAWSSYGSRRPAR